MLMAVLSIYVCGPLHAEGSGQSDVDRESRNKAQVRRYLEEIFKNRDLSEAHEFLSPKLTVNGRNLQGGYANFFQNIFRFLERYFDPHNIMPESSVACSQTQVSYNAFEVEEPRSLL